MKRQYRITSTSGEVTITDSLNKFANEVGIYYGQFYAALHKGTKTLKGDYKVEFFKDEALKEGKLEILDITREGNTHKVKFKNKSGNIHTRKIDLKKVNNLQGQKCDYSGVIIPMNNLSASCNDGKDTYTFSVEKLKQLGYSFDIDFSAPKVVERIVEKEVKVFSTDLLQEHVQDKMDALIKEIKSTQTKLTKLNTLKDNLGKSLSQIDFVSNNIESVDNLLRGK